jgi:hypothetical protein
LLHNSNQIGWQIIERSKRFMLDLSLITVGASQQSTDVLLTVYFLTDFFNEYAAVCFVSHDETYNSSENQVQVNFQKFWLHYAFYRPFSCACGQLFHLPEPQNGLSKFGLSFERRKKRR